MGSLFSFRGRIGRLPYAVLAPAIAASQHFLVALVFMFRGRAIPWDLEFWLVPARKLAALDSAGGIAAVAAIALMIVAAWALAALSFRRATDANIPEWWAVFAVVPVLQILAVAALALAPSRPAAEAEPAAAQVQWTWSDATPGMLAGVALTLGGVGLGVFVFREYGFGLFIIAPFVIGVVTGYLVNRRGDIGAGRTLAAALVSLLLGGLALVVTALEGVVCIVMAAPLAAGMGVAGAAFGRFLAPTRRSRRNTLSVIAVLPLTLAFENVLRSTTTFETRQTIDIVAPAADVWNALLHVTPIKEPLSLPFRLGLAYPISGDVLGEGLGAPCRAVFSTGIAHERVTEWLPQRKFGFTVVREVPSMKELSPYREVHAPHVEGYFRTLSVRFEIVPHNDGTVTVIQNSRHEIRLDPVAYWLPVAQWVIAETNARAMLHLKNQAEAAARSQPH